ncbi:XRE family transcriptional regulator [Salinisphaera sp. SPP-AMP-43]|uniref:LexA family protein n=1 Tax=Salinisphaera sp. SPP-AMP-43 TaxID=3121288 RepID=UPI003C6E9D93
MSEKTFNTVGERVKYARKEAGMSVVDLAQKTKLARTTIYDLERGDSKSTTRLPAIAAATGFNATWLETGYGLMRGMKDRGATRSELSGDNFRPARSPVRWAPIVSFAEAGNWAEVIDAYEPGDSEHHFPVPPGVKCSASSFWTELSGLSMVNTIGGGNSFPPGSFVLIDPEVRDAITGRFVLARLNDDSYEATFKRLNVEGSQFYLEPLNTQYPVIEIASDSQIIGTMKSALLVP